jgi:23S rRNA pseudouridine1911/1915/1917 synthase
VGDATYGPPHAPRIAPRQFLHAQELHLTHPITGVALTFSVPLPPDLQAVLDALTLVERVGEIGDRS